MSAATPWRILLVTADLMTSSRVAGTACSLGHAVDTRTMATMPADNAEYDVVLIDVQSCPEPAGAIARGRAAAGGTGKVIAFGPHVWKERLEAAVAAGADAAATRGEVMEGLVGLLGRVVGRAPHNAPLPDSGSPLQ